VYGAPDYSVAADLARKVTGKAITQQGFALRARIQEAEELITEERLIEVHPEVSFRAMAGKPLAFSKHTWNGLRERARLLKKAGIVIPDQVLGSASDAAADDLLDAAAAAWTALRFQKGRASTLPSTPRATTKQHPIREVIWY
jgi:predicted RNase H-like nuclease